MSSPVFRTSRWLVTVSAVALVAAWPAATRVATAAGDYAWQFDVLETLPQVPGCSPPSLTPDELKVDQSGRVIVAWRESGCGAAPGSGFRWGRRDAGPQAWTLNTIADQACGFLACVGLRGNPPALALRPDGAPFYLFGREGPFEYIYVAMAGLEGNPAAFDPALVEALAQYQSSISTPTLAADFPANAGAGASPNYVRSSPSGGPLTLNAGTVFENQAIQLLRYANGPLGEHHLLFYGSIGAGSRYYYSNGTYHHAVPVFGDASSETTGLDAAVDSHNRIHLVATGLPGDYNFFWSSLAYLTSDDGVNWSTTVLDHGLADGHSNQRPSIALDTDGNPAIAYYRYPDEIRLTRFDGLAWHDGLVSRTGSPTNAVTAPQVAFDGAGRPIVFFNHAGTNSLVVATGQAGLAASALSVTVAGPGVVTSTPAGIACPGACSQIFHQDAYVTLVPAANVDAVFAGWTGACTGTGPCLVQMTSALSVGAVFSAAPRHHIAVDASCTLPDAIRAANTDAAVNGCEAGSGPDTIDLPAGTYTLTAPADNGHQGPDGLPAIYTDIAISGAGAANTIIERAEGAPDFRIFYVDYSPAGGRLTLSGVTVRGGRTMGAGLLMASGPVLIADSVFEDNNDGDNSGGAIRVWESNRLEIARTTFRRNYARYGGGAIESGGPLTMVDSVFDANTSDGNGGTLEVSGTTLILNTGIVHSDAVYAGGAVYNGGTLTVSGSTFDGNWLHSIAGGSGAAIGNNGTLVVLDSTFIGNHATGASGGAIGNDGTMTIVGSTITGNDSDRNGGGIRGGGTMRLTNITVSGNRADGPAGGIYNNGTLLLESSTITNNQGVAGWGQGLTNVQTVTLRNTIISGNLAGDLDCYTSGSFTSRGYNFIGGDYNCLTSGGPGDQAASYTTPIDARLGPLADNGGTTWTHALLPDSPALNAGNPGAPGSDPDACPAADQRGETRPQRSACDIGAFEKSNLAPVAAERSATTDEDHAVEIELTASDGDGDAYSFAIAAPPAHGAVTISGATATYEPAPDFNGIDSFAVASSDAFGATGAAAAVTVTVTAVNDPPTAADDTADVNGNGGLQPIDVLANDSDDPDTGETLAVLSVTDPAHGTAIVGPNGTVLYSPQANYSGPDAFTYTIGDGHPGSTATGNVAIEVSPSADIAVSIGASPNPVAAGDTLFYTVTMTNNGPNDAHHVEATVTLAPGLGYSYGCLRTGDISLCRAPEIPAGGHVDFEIAVEPSAPGSLPAFATLTHADEFDWVAGNNSASTTVSVEVAAQLTLEMLESSDPIRAGEPLTYGLNIFNIAGVTAHHLVVTDTLPGNATFVSAVGMTCDPPAGQTLVCRADALPLRNGVGVVITVIPTVEGTITNTASVHADEVEADIVRTETTTVSAGAADLMLSASDSPDPVTITGNLTYTLTVTNRGPFAATETHVIATLPIGVSYISADVSGDLSGAVCGHELKSRIVDCNLGTLLTESARVITIVTSPADATAMLHLSAIVGAAEPDPVPLNNLADIDTTPLIANLALVVTPEGGPLLAGRHYTYTAVITNSGPADATDVVLHVDVPYPWDVDDVPGCRFSYFDAMCDIGTIPVGTQVQIAITYQLTATAHLDGERTLSFRLTSSPSAPDPDLSDNVVTFHETALRSSNLQVAMTDSVDPVFSGDRVGYKITIRNWSELDAHNVKATVTIPSGLVFAHGEGEFGYVEEEWQCPAGGQVITCTLANLTHGGTSVLHVSALTPSGLVAQIAPIGTVIVTADDPDVLPADNTGAEETSVLPYSSPKKALVILVEDNNTSVHSASWEQIGGDAAHVELSTTASDLGLLGDALNALGAVVEDRLRDGVHQMMNDALTRLQNQDNIPACYRDVLTTLITAGAATGDNPWQVLLNHYGEASVAACLRAMAEPYYDRVVVLTDESASFASFKTTLESLDAGGFTIDMLLSQHGCGSPATMNNADCNVDEPYLVFNGSEGITAGQLRSINGGNLRLGSVYMVSCWGQALNQMWIEMGAKASNGAQELNYYVLISPFSFLDHFTRLGMSLEHAAQAAYEDERPLMAGTDLNLTVDFRWVPGCASCVATLPLGPIWEAALNRVLSVRYGQNHFLPVNTGPSSRRFHMSGEITPTGLNQTVSLDDGQHATPLATVAFSNVVQSGSTSVVVAPPGVLPPSGFRLGNPATSFELRTSALFEGPATVCFHYADGQFQDESQIQLWHMVGGSWINEMASVDTDANTVCATVSSFSPFAIVSPNESPVARDDEGTVDEDSSAIIDVLANDTDRDDELLTVTEATQGSNGTTAVLFAGIRYQPSPGFSGTDAFDYTITDGSGATATAHVTVTVRSLNEAPVLTNPGNQTTGEGEAVVLQIAATDVNHDDLAFTAAGLPAGLTMSASGLITGTPTDQSAGAYVVTVTVSDGALSADDSFNWTIVDMSGRMHGEGHVAAGGATHHFEFKVTERRDGADFGRIEFWARETDAPKKKGRELNRFAAGTITAVTFSRDARVRFSGSGRWNGARGYTFEAVAADKGEPGIGHDTFAITIRSPGGTAVASVSGVLTGGNIQSLRLPASAH